MASSRRVSNDVISLPPLSPQLCSAVLWAVAARADVLFGVEQHNEQQAEVRNVCHLITIPKHICVCVYSSISLSERGCVCLSLASHGCGEILPPRIANTHARTHSRTGTSVMRSEESKSKEPQRCTLSRVRGEREREEGKAVRWETKEGRWKAGAGVLRPPGNFWHLLCKTDVGAAISPLPCSPLSACLLLPQPHKHRPCKLYHECSEI